MHLMRARALLPPTPLPPKKRTAFGAQAALNLRLSLILALGQELDVDRTGRIGSHMSLLTGDASVPWLFANHSRFASEGVVLGFGCLAQMAQLGYCASQC
jgi:hypothetical protein